MSEQLSYREERELQERFCFHDLDAWLDTFRRYFHYGWSVELRACDDRDPPVAMAVLRKNGPAPAGECWWKQVVEKPTWRELFETLKVMEIPDAKYERPKDIVEQFLEYSDKLFADARKIYEDNKDR